MGQGITQIAYAIVGQSMDTHFTTFIRSVRIFYGRGLECVCACLFSCLLNSPSWSMHFQDCGYLLIISMKTSTKFRNKYPKLSYQNGISFRTMAQLIIYLSSRCLKSRSIIMPESLVSV